MLDDASDADRAAALTTLISRNLVADTDIQAGQLLIQQHNLSRDSAYAQLKATPTTWETAERTAAHLWLTSYTPPPNAECIETCLLNSPESLLSLYLIFYERTAHPQKRFVCNRYGYSG